MTTQSQSQSNPPTPSVYILTISTCDRGGNEIPTIQGVYASLMDANNAAKNPVNTEFSDVRTFNRSFDKEGLISWSAGEEEHGEKKWI